MSHICFDQARASDPVPQGEVLPADCFFVEAMNTYSTTQNTGARIYQAPSRGVNGATPPMRNRVTQAYRFTHCMIMVGIAAAATVAAVFWPSDNVVLIAFAAVSIMASVTMCLRWVRETAADSDSRTTRALELLRSYIANESPSYEKHR